MIYFVEAKGVGHIKIGFTDGDDALVRLADLQTGSPVPLQLVGTIPGTLEGEKDLHRRFASSRVHGEWFKPVPDLLALIPASDARACEGVEIVERSVSIRVLTVGRKQLSKALLYQLPILIPINWRDAVRWSLDETGEAHLREFARRVDLTHFLYDVDLWGWIRDGQAQCVIFVSGGKLCRHYDSYPASDQTENHQWNIMLRLLWDERRTIPGWRDEDQLFFGV